MLRGLSRFIYFRGSIDDKFKLLKPKYSDDAAEVGASFSSYNN